ncbi:MAG: MFS transporter, partial [Verrucomicrobiaceae bacterium]|nr:MFS transporter [Verrucomicrobiaceae bacterium]
MKYPYPTWKNVILIVGILLVSINLRPSITAVGALAERIHLSGLSLQEIGALTTVPLILFGLIGVGAGWVGGRIGFARALGVGLLLLAAGCWIRSIDVAQSGVWRIGGTVLIGAGIALGNVLLPGVVKSRFPRHVGPLTSLYSTALNLGAALGVAFAVPLADALSGGWPASLSTWGWVAILTLLIWSPQMRSAPTRRPPVHPLAGLRSLAKQRRAWGISAHMGLQSMVFYSSISWLPSVLQSRGMEESAAAQWVTAMQILGCVSS